MLQTRIDRAQGILPFVVVKAAAKAAKSLTEVVD